MSEGNGKAVPVCYLGMPAYGGVSMRAAQAFLRAADPKRLQVHASYRDGSLLNSNCNGLWAWALGAQRCGRPVNYFAMLHADVQPPDGWLAVLVDELESSGLDVLGVAVPIKDANGMLSTALGHEGPQNYYKAFCRVSLRELFQLPETFTAADCGHPKRPLLVNTGCFVCRFDWRWAEKVIFQDQNRIRWDGDKYRVETFPEDWNFSRQCVALGLKVGCTRRVRLDHRGWSDFGTAGPWGESTFDAEYLSEPAIRPAPPADDFRFPHEVGGWLTEREGRKLAELARGKDVLEIGCYMGKSTVCLAQTAAEVHGVDTFDGRGTPAPRPTRAKFDEALRAYGVADKVHAWQGTFEDVAPRLSSRRFDLIFVDGDHAEESVARDIEMALPLLAPGGVLAFHDYGDLMHPGVKAAVDKALWAKDAEYLSLTESLAVVRPAAAETLLQGV